MLAEERFEAEQQLYAVRLSTTFLVTQAQRDLLQAQVNLLQTTFDYESSLVNFEAVQQAPPLAAGDTLGVAGAPIDDGAELNDATVSSSLRLRSMPRLVRPHGPAEVVASRVTVARPRVQNLRRAHCC